MQAKTKAMMATGAHRHLFVTGVPGIGKTTRILQTVEWLLSIQVLEDLDLKHPYIPCAGITTEEVRDERGRRYAFDATGIHTQERVTVAHEEWYRKCKHTVGKYGVHLMSFEELLRLEMQSLGEDPPPETPNLVVLDEIGRMEACSDLFKSIVEESLQKHIVLATISKAKDKWISKIRNHPQAKVIELTRHNRKDFTDQFIIPWLRVHYQIPETVPGYEKVLSML